MTKKLFALLLALCMVLGMLAGCGGDAASAEEAAPASETVSAEAPTEEPTPAEEAPTEEPVEEPSAAEEASVVEAQPVEEEITYASMADKYFAMSMETNAKYKEKSEAVETTISYPLGDGTETLSMWRVFSAFIWNGLMESYADMPIMPDVVEATGVSMEFIECSDSAAWEQFNLTIASGDYPDLMSMDYYSGGVEAAYEDEVIVDLTDLIDENMPHYMVWVDEADDYTKKSLYTDDGRILRVFTLASNVISEQGLSYRADWAEEFGMGAPVTTEDMYQFLTAAKNKYDCVYPIFIDNSGVL